MKRQPPRMVSNALMIFITVLALGGGFALGILFSQYPLTHHTASTAAQTSTPAEQVPGRGRIEPASGVVHLGPGAPDRVVKINVKEGQTVEKNAILIELESLEERRLALDMAQTRLEEARKQRTAIDQGSAAEVRVVQLQREQLEAMHPYEVRAQNRKIELLEKQQQTALTNWKRVQEVPGNTISDQDRDQQRIVVEQSNTQLREARIALEQLEAKQKLDRALLEAREEAARSKADQAKSEISVPILEKRRDQVEEQKEQSILRAPTRGKILHIMTHVGELVGGKPILEMADVEHMDVVAEIHETFYWRVAVGQKAAISSKIPIKGKEERTLSGKVIQKDTTFGQQSLYGLDPRSRRDDRVFEVRIRLDDSSWASDLIGHQVDVSIDPRSRAGK